MLKQDGKTETIAEIAPILTDWLLQMAHTPDGAKVRRDTIWRHMKYGLLLRRIELCMIENSA